MEQWHSVDVRAAVRDQQILARWRNARRSFREAGQTVRKMWRVPSAGIIVL
jgi:hypothetical protein